jgi:hypothetical protein
MGSESRSSAEPAALLASVTDRHGVLPCCCPLRTNYPSLGVALTTLGLGNVSEDLFHVGAAALPRRLLALGARRSFAHTP